MLDLQEVMGSLSKQRPIFNNEADFQHALAWEIHSRHPAARTRLEYRPTFLDKRAYLDIWVVTTDWTAAIELKYFTGPLDVEVDGERFELRDQSAQDAGRYDFIRDIVRLETVREARPAADGYVVLLTNDSLYWRPPTHPRPTLDADFRIHEGVSLSGTLRWSPKTSPGSIAGRAAPHVLRGTYPLTWRDYSRVGAEGNGEFRYLLVRAE